MSDTPRKVNPALVVQLQKLLREAAEKPPATGFLAWKGHVDFPDGAGRTPSLSQRDFENWYLRLQNAALAQDLIPSFFGLEALTNDFRSDGPLPISIVDLEVTVPKPAFAKRVVEAAENDRALDPPPGDLASVVETARVFMASGLMHEQWQLDVPVFRSRFVSFVVDERFYVKQPGRPLPTAIEVDAGDGKGFRAVQLGRPFLAQYEQDGTVNVAVRCRYGDDKRKAHFSFTIDEKFVAPEPDEIWPLYGLPSGNTGNAQVYRAYGNSKVANPILIAEPFPGGYAKDYLYDMVNQNGAAETLRAAGYDIIVVTYDNGIDWMQRNAEVFVAALQQTMQQTAQPIVVGGYSMGGVVARYALTWMEAHGLEHNTRLYFSVDAPHRGATMALPALWFAHVMQTASVRAAAFVYELDAMANKQFTMNVVADGKVQESPEHAAFMRQLNSFGGYPKKLRRIALASGRGDGKASTTPRHLGLEWHGGPFASASLWTLPQGQNPEVVGEAYAFAATPPSPPPLTTSSQWSWDAAPGGTEQMFHETAKIVNELGFGDLKIGLDTTCAVPVVSALDIDQDPFAPIPAPGGSASPFHDYICANENIPHIWLTADMTSWLVAQIGKPPVVKPLQPLQQEWDPAAFNPHTDVAFMKNPYPTYARFREKYPVFWVEATQSYWVFRYDDVKRVLDDTNGFLKNRRGAPPYPAPPLFDVMANMPQSIFSADNPQHDRVRGIINPIFTEVIQGASNLAARLARPLLVNAKKSRRIELMTAYAAPLPSAVLQLLMGVPSQDWPGLNAWVDAVVAADDPTQPIAVQAFGGTCTMSMGAYYQALLRGTANAGCPFKAAQGGLVERMAEKSWGSSPVLSEEEVQANAVVFTIAGYASTTYLIGTGTLNLLNNPDQLKKLKDNPALVHTAVEEMLRYDGPVQLIDRYPVADTEICGVRIRAGEKVTTVVGSANHDPAIYDNPDRFDITRQGAWNLSFGSGIHTCIGAPLARMVTPSAILTLLEELPNMKLSGIPQWQSDPFLRAVSNLPIAVA